MITIPTQQRPNSAPPGNRNLGRLIRRYRRLREKTQVDVGRAIDRTREDISAIENAHIKQVPLGVLTAIQRYLRIPWEELRHAAGMASAAQLAAYDSQVQELADEISEVLPEVARILAERRRIRQLRSDAQQPLLDDSDPA